MAAANDRLFARFCAVLGHPEWGEDPRFRTNRDRIAHREVIVPLLSEAMRGRTSAEWEALLERAGIPASPIHDIAAVKAHPQVRALDILRPMGEVALEGVALPVSFGGERPPIRSGAPALGEANAALGAPRPKE